MSLCPRCGKRVFFAERKSSLGKDWHWQCLKCESCAKVLNPGQHAEHSGIPYCEVPCYKALFGPKLHGFWCKVKSHDYSPKSGRKIINSHSSESPKENLSPQVKKINNLNVSMSSSPMVGRAPKVTPEELMDIESKLKVHNDAHPQNFINLIEKDGHVNMEGLLRVHWGVQSNIKFKKDDSQEATPFTSRIRARRVNKTRSFHNDLYADLPEEKVAPPTKDPFGTLKSSGIPPEMSSQQLLAVKMKRGQFHTIREQKIRRRFSINGHYYNNELESIDEDKISNAISADFTPAFGSVTQVFVGSHLRTPEVIKRLLDKFKIMNEPSSFALYMVKANGEMWPLTEDSCPMLERVELQDPTARIFLMDKPYHTGTSGSLAEKELTLGSATVANVWQPVEPIAEPPKNEKISHELAGFMALPDAMLIGFLTMFNNEQTLALEKIRNKYATVKAHIKKLMGERQLTQETYL
ncbi:ras association domain-containing protein 2-like isoform X2 [Watersipora subatra]|uniref:ras association domain-containing protein 2-like isoform X2 n=1 Tax=Watersipora subatra TaxID=2589382 RepID=UPI00355B194F